MSVRHIPVRSFGGYGRAFASSNQAKPMTETAFAPDCARCIGLCCMALAFDRSALFAEDKPAGVPCRHLGADDCCTIHARRAETGFAGCVGYDCLGAGQMTVALFAGRHWRESVAGRKAMMAAFGLLRRVQALRLLLVTAGDLPLTPGQAEIREGFLAQLDAETWTLEALEKFDLERAESEVRTFLRTLRGMLEDVAVR